ncbi:hypothetical protein IW262DRAFT_1291080 [Armillaria fumosa]|nr:hypothetical protein IW262DRAFT_1291080 [Armillaria fumosa]
MVAALILLHVLSTINFTINWSQTSSTFVNNYQSFWTSYIFYITIFGQKMTLVGNTTTIICTILADFTMIWCCWIVWGKRWLIILPPVLFLISAIVSLILCIIFYAYGSSLTNYFDVIAGIAKRIAPTLLVGCVAASHAHSDDSWQGSMISGSLHFRTHSGSQNSQQDSIMSSDLEAQVDQQNMNDEYTHHPVAVESQDGLANEGSIHKDDPEALEDSGVNSENVIHRGDFED